MVDEVEDPVIPSASELGIVITPPKKSDRTAKMRTDTDSKKVALNLEIIGRFGEEEAAVSEPVRAISSDEIAQQEQAELESRKKKKNGALREWLFDFFPKYTRDSAKVIENIAYLKDNMLLTPAEKLIFEEAVQALSALQAVQAQLLQKLQGISIEEFLNKSEKEQLEIILDLYDTAYLKELRQVVFPAYNATYYLDKIFASRRDEIMARTDREKFAVVRSQQINLEVQARIMQVITRIDMLASSVIPLLEPSLGTELQSVCNKLGEISAHANELDRINPLCRQNDTNIPEVGFDDFIVGEKAERFLAFLNEKDASKVAYFRLLGEFYREGYVSLENENLREIIPFIAGDLDKLFRPVQGDSDIYLIPLAYGESLSEEDKLIARKNKTPILARIGESYNYVVYGYKDGEWKETILTLSQLTEDRQADFKRLSFSRRILLKSVDISEGLIKTLKESHTSTEEEKIEKQHKERQEQQQNIQLAFTNIRSFLLESLKSDFTAFAQQIRQAENRAPAPSADLDLKDEDAMIPSESVKIDPVDKPKLKRSQSEPRLRRMQPELQGVKTQSEPGIKRTTSSKSLSRVFDTAAVGAESTIKRLKSYFLNTSTKAPFFGYAHTALKVTKSFQAMAKEGNGHAEYGKLEFIYKRRDEKDKRGKKFKGRIPKTFREGDSSEIRQNGELICSIIPQKRAEDAENEANGVEVVIQRHEKQDILLAVRIMVASLTKTGEKEILIGIDSDSPEANELVLRYVAAVFRYAVIPKLLKNGEALDEEQTKAELQRMASSSSVMEYRFLGDRYEAEIDRIKRTKKTDDNFLADFDKFMNDSSEYSFELMPEVNEKNELAPGILYFEVAGDKLKYTIIVNDRQFEDTINIIPPIPLTQTFLESKRKEILEFTSEREHTQNFCDIEKTISRLAEITLIDHNLTQDEFVNKLVEYIHKISTNKRPAYTLSGLEKIKEDLKKYLEHYLAKPDDLNDVQPQDIATEIFNLAARKLKSDLRFDEGKLYVISREEQVHAGLLFLHSFDMFLQDPTLLASPQVAEMYSPNTNKSMKKEEIATELTRIVVNDNLLATDALVSRLLAYAIRLCGVRVIPKKELEKITKDANDSINAWVRERYSYQTIGIKLLAFLTEQIESASISPDRITSLPLITADDSDKEIELLTSDNIGVVEGSEEKDSFSAADSSAADVVFSEQGFHDTDEALDDILFVEDSDDGFQMSFEEFLLPEVLSKEKVIASKSAAGAMPSQERIADDTASEAEVHVLPSKEMIADISSKSEVNRIPLQNTVSPAAKVVEPTVAIPVNTTENDKPAAVSAPLTQKPAFLAEIEKGDFTFTRKAALKPLAQTAPTNPRSALLTQLKSGDLKKGLKSFADTAPPQRNNDNLQGTLFQNAASLIIARRQALDDDRQDDMRDDEDWDWDDGVDAGNSVKNTDKDATFLQILDAILQQRKSVAAINQPITIQDPQGGKQLDELAILTRLATMALVDKTMTEEAFLERIITFAFVSPKLASNVPLTPQKTAELKKELRSKFQGKEIDPEHIDELVSKLVKIARHEYSKGHTSKEIVGQHRDLYQLAKETVVSHTDDDGEGETRAPAMSHTH